jgi:hypothetical protein
MIEKIIKIILGFFAIGVVFAAGTDLTSSPAENIIPKEQPITATSTIDSLSHILVDMEDKYFANNGTYLAIPPTFTTDKVQYKVDEIKVWGGKEKPESQSYVIHIMTPEYEQEAFGVGKEAAVSSYSWKTFTNESSSTTDKIIKTLK